MAASASTVVLLVDDQPFIAAVVERLLATESDIALHTCTDGRVAVAEAARIQPSVILQDLVMPDVDGLALIDAYRAHPATAGVPVIVLSGNDDPAVRAEAAARGAADYLVKLPPADLLLASIRQHGPARQIRAASPDPHSDASDTATTAEPTLLQSLATGTDHPLAAVSGRLIAMFVTEADTHVTALKMAANAGDLRELAAHAHALRGASAVVGADRLALLSGQLEQRANRGAQARVVAVLTADIEAELTTVKDTLLQAPQTPGTS